MLPARAFGSGGPRRWVVSRSSLILAFLLVGGLAVSARAEEKLADAQVPFAFTVGTTQLPAGHYAIVAPDPAESGDIAIRNVDTEQTVFVDYLTRLASRRDDKSVLVFDELGGKHILSEIHVAGSDGYLLPAAGKKPHAHRQVMAN
jgi:hypothetical protein